MPMLLALWFIYGSYERVGQLWFSFGWEIQILETTLLAAVLAHPWDPRPLAAPPPPTTSIVLMRWLVFRIMLGAGSSSCAATRAGRELTCLDWHFETQPTPESAVAVVSLTLPHAVHRGRRGVSTTSSSWSRRSSCSGRAGCGSSRAVLMAAFQIDADPERQPRVPNWLTLVPVLACFDDDFLRVLVPRALAREVAPARAPRTAGAGAMAGSLALIVMRIADVRWPSGRDCVVLVLSPRVGARDAAAQARSAAAAGRVFAGLVIVKSCAVVDNLLVEASGDEPRATIGSRS